MTSDDRFSVVLCPSCSGKSWITETNKCRNQSTVACPHCGQEEDTEKLKVVATGGERAGAAEKRARYHAAIADEDETYNRFINEHGPYNKQLDAVDDQQMEVSEEALDLTVVTLDEQIEAHYGPAEQRDNSLDSTGVRSFEEDRARFEGIAESRMEQSRLEQRDRFADQVSDSVVQLTNLIEDYYGEPVDEDSSRYLQQTDPVDWGERADRDDLVRGEITPSDQTHAWFTLDLDEDTTISAVWESLFEEERVQKVFATSVRQLFTDLDLAECHEILEDLHIPYWLRAPILNVARGSNRDAWRIAVDIIPEMHKNPLVATEDLLATAQLFAGFDGHLSLAAVIDEQWLDGRRDQRKDVCDLLSVLAANLDVKVCSSGIVLRKVIDAHRLDLPGVSDWCSRGRSSSGFGDLVNDAMAELDKDDREVTILRRLHENGGPMSYNELYAQSRRDESRVRQCLSELRSYDLINRFGPPRDRMAELLEAGVAVIEEFDKEIARKRRIESFVSDAGQTSTKGRVTPHGRSPPQDGHPKNSGQNENPWSTQYLSTPDHSSAVSSADNGSVTLVPGGIDEETDRTRWVSYDPDRDEAVVAVIGADPMTYVASSAIALASPEFLNRALPPDRLSSINEPPIIIQEARCIGGASDEALDDPTELRSKLVDWGNEIEDMTRRLKHGEYDDRNALRRKILQKSHGLFGSIVHLLDAVGIDIVREIRVPGEADRDRQLGELAKSIGVSVAIQSKYRGVFTCYRQLFEKREHKRDRALTPTINSTDPYGDLIGSIVVRGPDIHRLEPSLRTHLEDPAEEHDDALEIAVTVPIQYVDRNAFSEVTTRILAPKNLRPTREIVSLFYALVESPHDLAHALHHRLGREEIPRELRPDEARQALAGVGHDALCPDLPRSVGKMIVTLMQAQKPLCKDDLAEQSNVSEKTVDRHEEKLKALGLLLIEDNKYRLSLSFSTKAERRSAVLPDLVTASDVWTVTLDVVDELLVSSLPADRYADPADPVGGVLWQPQTPLDLLDHADFGPWIALVVLLSGGELPSKESASAASMGPGPATIQQTLPIRSQQLR